MLSERFDWTEDITPESDTMCDDTPIRALLEGWDAVARRGPLHPSWQIIRRIDETLFGVCPNTERLAIMRAMHTLLQFHTASTAERYARLPPWYMRRPSQKIAHSYAIDYFAWPGVRERFIFSEHEYCGNEFWHLFTKSLRILWPYEFRDCYTREIETGLYKVSTQFDERLADIRCWTMGPDIFRRFPELYSDMPTFNNIPQAPSSAEAKMLTQMQRKKLLPLTPSPKTTQTGRIVDEDKDEEAKPPPAGSQYLPVDRLHTHVVSTPLSKHSHRQHTSKVRQQQNRANLSTHSYSVADFTTPVMPFDAYAYGAINEADFANVYHSQSIDGYPNMMF